MDITFYNGELHGITRVNEYGAPVLKNIHQLCIQYDVWDCRVRYIIELLGKLVMVDSSY